MKLPKQKHIDTGQLGGMLQIIIQSMGLLTLFNFIGIASLFYDRFLSSYFPIYIGIALIIAGAGVWWITYYTLIYPSIIQFSQRQAYAHNSPVKKDFEKLNQKIDKLADGLKQLQEVRK